MNDVADFLFRGASIGTVVGVVLYSLLELVDPDSIVGEFWQAFKNEQG